MPAVLGRNEQCCSHITEISVNIKIVYPTNNIELYIEARSLSINGFASFTVEFLKKTEYRQTYEDIPIFYVREKPVDDAPWSGVVKAYSKCLPIQSCGAVLLTPRFVLSSGI